MKKIRQKVPTAIKYRNQKAQLIKTSCAFSFLFTRPLQRIGCYIVRHKAAFWPICSMRPLLYDVAFFHHKNHIGIFDGGQPVRNDKAGTALHQRFHRLLYQNLCTCIHRTGSFIQNQNGRICQQRSGNRCAAFAPCEILEASSFNSVSYPSRQCTDKVIHMGSLCRLFNLLIGGV